MRASEVTAQAEWLTVVWEDGCITRHYAAWLRDNSPAPDARHPVNGQRLFDIAGLEDEIAVRGAWIEADGAVGMVLNPDGHQTRFDAASLRPPRPEERRRPLGVLAEEPWEAVRGGTEARRRWLAALADEGAALLTGLPADAGAGAEVIALFGYPRETNYGRSFAVVAVSDPNNLAFSDAALGPHTDNPYRDPVPGLQLLHCLENATEGGESVLVDGFAVAERLRAEAPGDFDLLSTYAIPFRFRDAQVDLQAEQRVIQLDGRGRLAAIHYNNRSAAPFRLSEAVLPAFYGAYRRFGARLQQPGNQHRRRLRPGDLLAMDNRRVLHGRTAVVGGGRRHLVGWYADRDGLLSKVAKMLGDTT